jgi:arylsulfatase
LIVHWPNGIKRPGELRHAAGHMIDVLPTILDLAGGPALHPNPDGPQLPGRSLVPAFAKDVSISREFLYFHHENNHALRVGDWKLVSKRPFTNDYALYNLKLDRAEQINLAASEPKRLTLLSNMWQKIETTFREEKDFSPATISH